MVLYDLTNATDIELKALIEGEYDDEMLFTAADEVRRRYYGDEVFLCGLIEFTNYCKTIVITAAYEDQTVRRSGIA